MIAERCCSVASAGSPKTSVVSCSIAELASSVRPSRSTRRMPSTLASSTARFMSSTCSRCSDCSWSTDVLPLEAGVARLERAVQLRDLPLGALALGDVVRGGVQQPRLDRRRRHPHEPGVRAVLAAVAVLEGDRVDPARELRDLGQRGLAIVGVDEVEERARHELVDAVAQHALERRVETLEVAVHAGHAEHVEREREEAVELGEPASRSCREHLARPVRPARAG